MAAEGGEVLLQRLLIADVGEHLAAPGQPRRANTGEEQAGAGHQGRQPQTLEGHRFAAGVRAGDRHHPQLRSHPQAHRHHRPAALAALLPQQQRMAQLPELKGSGRIGLQLWPHRPQPGAIAGPRHSGIEPHQHRLQVLQGRGLLPHQATELQENFLLDLPLPSLQLADAVAQGNHRLGLHEHGAAGGRAVVHDATHLGGRAGLHRQHRPAVPLGHHRVLQQGGPAPDQLLQALTALGAHPLQLATQALQLGAGAVGHPAPLLDREVKPLLQLRQGA